MGSVLGALGYLARESRPDLSGPVSTLQSRFNKAQLSDIQETNRVVRLAKAYTPDVKKNESGKGYRESSHHQSCGTKRRCL